MVYNGLHIVLSLVHSWLYMNMSHYNDVQWPANSLCLAIGLAESQEQGQANWWACTKSQCLSWGAYS